MRNSSKQLPRVAFCILLALSLKERHGYEIIKQIEEDSNGKVKLGPGALYTSIKQLRSRDLIAEVTKNDDTTRRYYKLTDGGMKLLESELEYYQNVIELARRRQVLKNEYGRA